MAPKSNKTKSTAHTTLHPSTSRGMTFASQIQPQKEKELLRELNEANKVSSFLLAGTHRITDLIGKAKVATVENLEKKINDIYRRMAEVQDLGPEAQSSLKAGQAGIVKEQHPELPDLGGMPLEQISAEWMNDLPPDLRDLLQTDISNIQDQAELENVLKNKLRNKLELANQLKNKLQQQLKERPKETPTMTPQLKQRLEQVVKLVEKLEIDNKPRTAPRLNPMG